MKIFNTFVLSFLILLSNQKINSMHMPIVIGLSQATLLYDVAMATAAITAAYFGYEVAAKHFRQKMRNSDSLVNQTSNFNYGTLKSLRQALHTLRSETKDLELFKDVLIDGFCKGYHIYLKSLEKQLPKKNVNKPNKKNPNPKLPKKNKNPRLNDPSNFLPLVEGARKLIESDIPEEVINKASNLDINSSVNGIYSTLEEIGELAKILIEGCGRIFKHCPGHHGGTIDKGVQTGLHLLRYLQKLIDKKLIDVSFAAEKSFKTLDKFRAILWRPFGPEFENVKYKLSTIFTGTLEEYQELLELAISKINWVELELKALAHPDKIVSYTVHLTDELSIVFKDFNFNDFTVSSIYPALTRIGAAAVFLIGTNNIQASQDLITEPIEFEIPESLLSNQNTTLRKQEEENESQKIKPQNFLLTEDTTAEEFADHIEKNSEPLDSIEHIIQKDLPTEKVESNQAFWKHIKYPTFLQQLEGNYKVMQAYGAYLLKQCKMNHKLDITYRQENIDATQLQPEFTINDIIKLVFIVFPNSTEARQIRQYIDNLTKLLISTNSTSCSALELTENRLKMLFINVGTDKFSDDFSYTRNKLIHLYFDKNNPSSFFEKNAQASELIAEFIKSCMTNQNGYISTLERFAQNKLYNSNAIINEAKTNYIARKEPSTAGLLVNSIINFYTDTLNPFAYSKDLLEDTRKECSLLTAAVINLSQNKIGRAQFILQHPETPETDKEILERLFFSEHRLKEFSKDVGQGIREKYGLMFAFKKEFGIEDSDLTNEIKKNQILSYLRNFTLSCQRFDQEAAIDSLMDLSSDSPIEEKKDIYQTFFTPQGILKNLSNKRILQKFEIPEIMATEQATELRRCLNYLLRFQIDERSFPIISQAIECLVESANLLNINPEESSKYLQAAQIIYLAELKNYPI